jgi:hypothetical protein
MAETYDSAPLMAARLNRAFRMLGGSEIRGLDQVDAKKLEHLQTQMASFMDGLEGLAQSNPELAQMVGSQALVAFHTMARIASASADSSRAAQNVMSGFCGGNYEPPAFEDVPPFEQPGRLPVGPLAQDGINFDPLASSACADAGFNNVFGNGGCFGTARPSSMGMSDPNLDSLSCCGGAGGCFEDRVFALMIKIVEDQQKKIEERLKKLEEEAKKAEEGGGKKGGKGGIFGAVGKIAGGVFGGPVGAMAGGAIGGMVDGKMGGGGGGGKDGAGGQESRNIEFEKIKFDMQKLSQMQQALSNILNTMDELAKSAIRQIKAG